MKTIVSSILAMISIATSVIGAVAIFFGYIYGAATPPDYSRGTW